LEINFDRDHFSTFKKMKKKTPDGASWGRDFFGAKMLCTDLAARVLFPPKRAKG
jgi:hypothetical protein